MAGHSKWANIKHRKGAQDKKRSKIFTRLIKEVTTATREAGPDPEMNPRLRLAISKAKAANVPKDTIERAVNKGSGADGSSYEEVDYEGYSSGGVAIYLECATDNLNRTVANVRAYFSKSGGSMANSGSVGFLFERKGIFTFSADATELEGDDLELELIDGGAEEIEKEDDLYVVTCQLEDYGVLSDKFDSLRIELESADPSRIPITTVALDVDGAQSVLNLIGKLEDDDDIEAVFHNLEMTDDLMAALSEED